MAFKEVPPSAKVPDSPEKLFLDLPRRKLPNVLPHQQEIMRKYASEALDLSDVALQLPTGSGKTLVGLLIAEWRRRRNGERIVYLCPTRQLVNQVVEQAEEKYGLTVLGFTGSSRNYPPNDKAAYMAGNRLAITTYTSLFNTNPFFADPDVVIVDDAHAAEGYISEFWSLRIERNNQEHENLHTAVRGVLRPIIDPRDFDRLSGKLESISDNSWVEKIPTPSFAEIERDIVEILDSYSPNTSLRYPWSLIRENLHGCHMYISSHEILIRPLIPPTWTHTPFNGAKQRIYMSATLGAGGDLERLMGRRMIRRLPTPEGWNSQGVGRRFFMFPGMSLDTESTIALRRKLIECTDRSLVLVPSERMRDTIIEDIKATLDFKIFRAEDIEDSKKHYTSTPRAVAVVANRYDGIDFPGDECRLLFVQGLPKATNLQERFLMSRMTANVLFNERIQTRILQAIGRCTRSLVDYSAIVVSDENLTGYLVDGRKRKFFHPELQAEIIFGMEQSKETSLEDFVENLMIFLRHGPDWEQVNQRIVDLREHSVQEAFPAMEELEEAVRYEVDFQTRLWQGDYEEALRCGEQVLSKLNSPNLRGYRALWHYLAGSAAWRRANEGGSGLQAKARVHFSDAKRAAQGIRWLVHLSDYQEGASPVGDDDSILLEQVERVETVLEEFGITHDRKFTRTEKEIIDGLSSKHKGPFEQAHKSLGRLLGFESGNEETDGSPDPWWIVGNLCFVFEDHAGAQDESALDVKKARQVSSHPAWMKANIEGCASADILAVLVTPVSKVKPGAVPHLNDVALWTLGEFRSWAEIAISVIRELRTPFVEPGDLAWRAIAMEKFEQNQLDAPSLHARLRSRNAADILQKEA